MFKFKLHHAVEGELILTTPPEGWDTIQISYSRSSSMFGFVRKYISKLGFAKEGNEFIKNILSTYGINQEIYIDITRYDRTTLSYKPFLSDGLILIDSMQEDDNFISFSIQDNSFDAKISTRMSNEVKYQSDNTIDGDEVYKVEIEDFSTVQVKGIAADSFVSAIYPFKLFERIVNIITNQKEAFRSRFIGKIGDIGSSYDGDGSRRMITKGLYLRSFEINTNNLSISLETLFKSFSAIFGLGMGVENYGTQRVLRVDKIKNFFQPVVIVTFDNIDNLNYEVNKDFVFNKISAGYGIEIQSEKDEDSIAKMEYNTKSTYSTPIKYFNKELSLNSNVRADGTGVENARTQPFVENTPSSNSYDDMIFILSCWSNSGNLETIEQEGFISVEGVYGSTPLYMNCDITPARMVKNWGSIINIPFEGTEDRYKFLKFEKNNSISTIRTRKTDEILPTEDCEDIPISSLERPFLTPFVAKFNATLSQEQLLAIDANPNGLIKFWDYIEKSYKFGFIKEISTIPIDKTTNVELMMFIDVPAEPAQQNYILNMQGDYILTMSNDLIIRNG